MKILFTHLGRENLGIEYLSSVLKLAGHETFSAIDIGLFGRNDNIFHFPRLERLFSLSDAVVSRFKSVAPDLVCMSAYSGTLKWCFMLAEEFKNISDVPIVVGGIHITLSPESAMLCPAIDYGIRGEAESVIAEFADSIADCSSPERLPGVIFRKDGKTVVNGFAHLIADLNSIPFPDKTLFEKHVRLQDDYLISTSRGCPNNCSYCCEHAVRNACGDDLYCRVRSVENLIEELTLMKSIYKYREVFFCSPTFPHDRDWLEDFSLRYRDDVGVPFRCHAHVSHVDRDYVRLLRKAGCKSIEFGVQSVNEKLRRDILGRAESNKTISHALFLCDSEDMPYEIGHIFRLPDETQDDYISAFRFYSKFKNIHRIKTFNLTLFPATRMLRICREKHLIGQEFIPAVERGESGDYFHFSSIISAVPEWKIKAFGHLLRFLPFVPKSVLSAFLKSDNRLKALSLLPYSAAKLIEMLRLLLVGDARLSSYLRMYQTHITRFLTKKRSS
jgi:hypothetical protein